jgi:acetoacetyl-CoA reductase
MIRIAIFGGSGGLGQKIAEPLRLSYDIDGCENIDYRYETMVLSSRDVDIRDYQACKKFFEDNEINVVINLAGVNHDKFIHKLDQKDQYLINHLLDVNLHGAVNIASACLPGMRERGYGRIIMVSSVLATKNVMGTALYSSCKAFIDRFIKSVSAENISKGITANSIQLGYFDGGMTDRLNDPEKFKQEIPLKRWGTPQELVEAIEFIIRSEYLTGVNLPLNGGL